VSQQKQTKSPGDPATKRAFDYNVALQRLVYVALIGCLFVLIYGLCYRHNGVADFFSVVSVGLMTAGAALLSGGLLGFLFGVPHTQGEKGQAGQETAGKSGESQGDAGARSPSTAYRPNTSLEEISDWLTKILVGVGLVQIKAIPGKLVELARYIANGLGGGVQAEAFALTVLIYFSVCGFVFGFLWARLYLVRWFREADAVQNLEEKISRLEKRQQSDARALAIVDQLINPQADDAVPSDEEAAKAIKAASVPVKVQIFGQAQKAATYHDADNDGVISVLRGLIASDTDDIYHRNHAELSYALRHKKPPDLPEADKEITNAIDIRNKLGKRGWKHYEFHRARCRIEQEPNYDKKAADPAFVQKILSDLGVAYSDGEKWQKWCTSDSSVSKWLAVNNIDEATLRQS
jgi:hypothetical protein